MTPTRQWFVSIARAEGLSLLLLFGVAMPLKYGAGITSAVVWPGWLHGVLVITYTLALGSVGRVEGWTWGRMIQGFVASLLPFGTFWFERTLGEV